MLSAISPNQEPVDRNKSTLLDKAKVQWAQRTISKHETLMRVLEESSLNMESIVYRACDSKYLDFKTMTLKGNPHSVARIIDHYHLILNPEYKSLKRKMKNGEISKAEFESLKETYIYKKFINETKYANELSPSLNVSGVISRAYLKTGYAYISIKLLDVIKSGGLVYKDVSSHLDITPLIVTIPAGKSIPFVLQEMPARN